VTKVYGGHVTSLLSAFFEADSLNNIRVMDVSGFNPEDRSGTMLQNNVKFLPDDNA
jgi:hypothetical protein